MSVDGVEAKEVMPTEMVRTNNVMVRVQMLGFGVLGGAHQADERKRGANDKHPKGMLVHTC